MAALIAGAGIQRRSTVLEVGCGTGNYISALQAETGCMSYGIDPSDEMLRRARSHGAKVSWICVPAEQTDFVDGQFDFVFSVDAVHHFRDRSQAFHENARLLSLGGLFAIVTDSEEIIRNRTPLSVYWPETIEIELARYPRTDTLKTELRPLASLTCARKRSVQSPSSATSRLIVPKSFPACACYLRTAISAVKNVWKQI
ncbi:MAG: class I SAM-dependent methyltransferase [Chthoniobacterales bacterium]